MILDVVYVLLVSFAMSCECRVLSGTGIFDCTGPIADVIMMGMANPKQVSAGLHQRLRARAFVVQEDDRRFAFVSMDAGMGSIVLNNRVVEELQRRFEGYYTHENVAISGTHTHSGPSGFLQDTIFQFAGSGWVDETVNAFTNCAVESIAMAHQRLAPASATVVVGRLDGANINRSPSAYLMNPLAERTLYESHGDTDKNMTLLKITLDNGTDIGMFNWFAVHPTSLNNSNTLVSGDNKGHASYLFERDVNGVSNPGKGPFVAAFASANLGDVSPNTNGARCRDTGELCDFVHSTCGGRSEMCSSSGPGKDMFESCEIIATKQYTKAKELFAVPGESVLSMSNSSFPLVDFRHSFVTMPGLVVQDPETGKSIGKLCKAAMGDSFAAGTTDGPGQFDFTQGSNSSNPFWHFIVSVLHKETPEEIACQEPKGILLPTGSINLPYPWAPSILPVQLLRWGQFAIVVVPTEMTTMAGRRMRMRVKQVLVEGGIFSEQGQVVIAGLGNGYADYTTTYEEYQQQRYEGASTIFGPHQLNAYIQQVIKLAQAMVENKPSPRGEPPRDFSATCIDKTNKMKRDALPQGASKFGQVLQDAEDSYKPGEVVTVVLAGANPSNDPQVQGSFVQVQRCMGSPCSEWETVAEDADWETRLHIVKESRGVLKDRRVWKVTWEIPAGTEMGSYRIKVNGAVRTTCLVCKPLIKPFTGISKVFSVSKLLDTTYFNVKDLFLGLVFAM